MSALKWFNDNVFDTTGGKVEPSDVHTHDTLMAPPEAPPQQYVPDSYITRQPVSVTSLGGGMPSIAPVAPAQDTSKFAQYFHDLLDKANLPRPDYFSFMDALQQMANLNIPEDAKYQAALATLKAIGLKDPSSLVNSAQQYIQILETDKAEFVQKADDKSSGETSALQADIKKLESDNEEAKQQIEELQKQIMQNTQVAMQKRDQINERALHYSTSKQGYLSVCESIEGKIRGDVVRLQNFIH